MKSRIQTVSLMLAAAVFFFQAASMAQEKGLSHVRVVRLSFVDGAVLVKRPGATEWAKASVNTPIEEGFRVSTGDKSFAEVEFENGSTARLGELSEIGFSELALAPSGAKINHLTFSRGYATFHLTPQHGDVYTIKAGQTTIRPDGKSEFRTDLKNGALRVEVFDGSVVATAPAGSAKLTKDKVLTFDPQTEDAFNITHGIQMDSWDKWVHQRDQQSTLAYNDSAVDPGSSMYGWSDLDEYGEWADFPGYGYGWSPYVGAGWSPFSMGQWSFYPSWGYTWISSEPWGWLPYHYGAWNFDPGFGYFWSPGDMGMFYPALVSWFAGPGYIGWAPMGVGGGPACGLGAAGCLTAVAPSVLQNGGVVDPTVRMHPGVMQLRAVQGPGVAPNPLAMLSGRPVSQGTLARALPSRVAAGAPTAHLQTPIARAAIAARPSFAAAPAAGRATSFATRQVARAQSTPAPRVVLMGESPAQAAKMGAVDAHRSFFSRIFNGSNSQPLVAHMGNTLGGRFAVGPMGGRMGAGAPRAIIGRPMAVEGRLAGRPMGIGARRGMTGPTPMFLGHRSMMGGGPPQFQMNHGSVRMMSNAGMTAPSQGMGGFRGAGRAGGFSGGMRAGPAMSAGHATAAGRGMAAGGARK